jgi:hypothetical protein
LRLLNHLFAGHHCGNVILERSDGLDVELLDQHFGHIRRQEPRQGRPEPQPLNKSARITATAFCSYQAMSSVEL